MVEIDLKQSATRKLNIELSDGADYTYQELNPDILTFDRATQTLRASDTKTSQNARILFTAHKNGYTGNTVILKAKVKKLYDTRIKASVSSIAIEENESIEFSINTDATKINISADNANIVVERIAPYRIRVTGITQGTSEVIISAQASEKRAKAITIPVTISQAGVVPPPPISVNKFYMGQIPTNTADWDWDIYDANPDGFNLEPFVQRTAIKGQLQEFIYDDIVNTGTPFQATLNSLNSFLWFAFEEGSGDNLDFNSTSNFEPLSKYPISETKKYKLTKDLGNGVKTYTILVTTTYRQSIPQLYIRK